jgi:hypothetical protein
MNYWKFSQLLNFSRTANKKMPRQTDEASDQAARLRTTAGTAFWCKVSIDIAGTRPGARRVS